MTANIQKALDFAAGIRAKREAAAAPPKPATAAPAAGYLRLPSAASALLRASGQGGVLASPAKPKHPAPKAPASRRVKTPELGEQLGHSAKRYLPLGVNMSAFAVHVGKTVAALEDLNGRALAGETGPAWIRCT